MSEHHDLGDPTDEDLIRAFIETGDQDAITDLLKRHESRVYGLAYRLLGNRPDAQDATQEVFISVVRKAKTFRFQSAFSTWLYRLTVNAAHDLRRKRSRAPIPTEDVSPESPDEVTSSLDRMAIDEALRHIPYDQMEAVVLRDLFGATYDEIAEATAVPVGTVKSRIARGRLQLFELLGEPTDDPTRLIKRENQ